MALDFPNSPTIGDEFTGGGFTWVWDGTSWTKLAAATTTGTGFSLATGTTGNTTYTFPSPQAAGSYIITSQLGDTTYDIYLVASDNTNVGYTNTAALEASAAFEKLVLYGATNNDTLNFEYKPLVAPATSGDVIDGAAPFLTSATPTTLESADDTTTVTGGNFASDVQVVFTGQDAVDRTAKNVVRSSSTELIVTRPDDFPVAQEPYSMAATNAGITNPSTNAHKLVDYFDAGGGITWVTGATLPAFEIGIPYSTTIEATDADGLTVQYALTAGVLPDGLSFDSGTAVISGTPTGANGAALSFTITATDSGNNTSDREFLLAQPVEISYVVVAGGGGAGLAESTIDGGGGGGGGGYRSSVSGESSGRLTAAESTIVTAPGDSLTVSVGAGGAGAPNNGSQASDGGSSSFYTVTSLGGGGGGSDPSSGSVNPASHGRDGGCGGGSSHACNAGSNPLAGNGTAGQGFDGGYHPSPSCNSPRGGAGGGGAGGDGGNATNPYTAIQDGRGGVGITTNITGSSLNLAGGGIGGCNNGTASDGRLYGGGVAANGTINTGGGAGGPCSSSSGATKSGGSGIVLLQYSSGFTINVGAGLTAGTTYTVGGNKVTEILAGTGNVSWS